MHNRKKGGKSHFQVAVERNMAGPSVEGSRRKQRNTIARSMTRKRYSFAKGKNREQRVSAGSSVEKFFENGADGPLAIDFGACVHAMLTQARRTRFAERHIERNPARR
jgi:hypothetical protein